jgi:hypothetical protein
MGLGPKFHRNTSFPLDALILSLYDTKGNKKLQNNNKNRVEDLDTVICVIKLAGEISRPAWE